MKMTCTMLTFVAMGAALCIAAETAAPKWPREIDTPEAKIVMYQPQLESFEGNRLTGRAAVAVTPRGRTEPVFGAVWIDARVSTDRDNRINGLAVGSVYVSGYFLAVDRRHHGVMVAGDPGDVQLDLGQVRLLVFPPFPAVMLKHFRSFHPDSPIPFESLFCPVFMHPAIHFALQL